ncbi:MAG: TIGR02757 family protein [Thermodesulfobacteriota bacterium]|nr:TIGR02757 family protein [Thermodesulfobacteriota bacterium]
MELTGKREAFDELYLRYNQRDFVHPDPLEFLYNYQDLEDREIAGLVASSLAYGRVAQILKSTFFVLQQMQPSPSAFLRYSSRELVFETFVKFKHRFTTGEDLASLLFGTKRVIERYGSLYGCFLKGMADHDDTVIPAISAFVKELYRGRDIEYTSLIPCPMKGSACKRLNLFLRWMVRKDNVDPGGWDRVPSSKLIIPLDTHMYSISRALRLTKRKQADMQTAFEITAAFKKISPEDPVKYDFALTRIGIRKEVDQSDFLNSLEYG